MTTDATVTISRDLYQRLESGYTEWAATTAVEDGRRVLGRGILPGDYVGSVLRLLWERDSAAALSFLEAYVFEVRRRDADIDLEQVLTALRRFMSADFGEYDQLADAAREQVPRHVLS